MGKCADASKDECELTHRGMHRESPSSILSVLPPTRQLPQNRCNVRIRDHALVPCRSTPCLTSPLPPSVRAIASLLTG